MKITWGIHKILYEFFTTADDNFAKLFFDTKVSEKVLTEVLSDRDDLGNITKPIDLQKLDMEYCEEILQDVHNYFTDFFFRSNKRAMEFKEQMEKIETNNLN